MTAPLRSRPVAIRAADLDDAHERSRVDGYVREADGATPFHLTAWTCGVERGTGQRGHMLLAEQADGRIVGVLPLTAMRSALFGRALVSTGFGVCGGVLADTPGVAITLADAGWALAERLGMPSLELRGGAPPPGWAVDDATYLGFARPLTASEDAELAVIPRKQRAEVRKALGFNLQVACGRSPALLAEHYGVYAESVRNLGTPVFPARLLREIAAGFGDDADVLTVRDGGVAVASVLSFYFRGTVYPYWGGGTRAARERRANDRLYFALMTHARTRGCTTFDFGRSKAGTGAAAFKKNWGFEGVPLAYAKRAAEGAAAREVNPLNPKYQLLIRTWKHLPLAIANGVGPWISRGLG